MAFQKPGTGGLPDGQNIGEAGYVEDLHHVNIHIKPKRQVPSRQSCLPLAYEFFQYNKAENCCQDCNRKTVRYPVLFQGSHLPSF